MYIHFNIPVGLVACLIMVILLTSKKYIYIQVFLLKEKKAGKREGKQHRGYYYKYIFTNCLIIPTIKKHGKFLSSQGEAKVKTQPFGWGWLI